MKRINLIALIIVLCCIHHISNAQNESDRKISLPFTKASIGTIINLLESNYNLLFSYLPDQIPLERSVTLSSKELSLSQILNEMFKNTDIQITFSKKQIILKRVFNQEKFTIHGKITDEITGEFLPGTNISIPTPVTGAYSNTYGFYSISLPKGEYEVIYSYLGYETVSQKVTLNANVNINISLKPKSLVLNEVKVSGNAVTEKNITSTTMGQTHLSAKEVKSLPSLGGQPDVFKSLQFLPGIVPVNDGIAHYSVRGGSFDQNLILLDEAPVYNPSHVLGFFSVFNADAIQSVDILRGYIPARYGGRLSSVADIHMREGNRNKLSVIGNIDPLSAGLTLESPLFGPKTSFLVSGRYFNFALLNKIVEGIKEIRYMPGLNNFDFYNKIHFYDFNFKINHKINPKNQIYLSGYNGSDGFYFAQIDDRSRQDWGNTTATFRWNHLFNDRLFSNFSAIYSRYNYAFNLNDGGEKYKWSAYMNQIDCKADFDYYLNPSNHVEFGAGISYLNIMPGQISPIDSGSSVSPYKMKTRESLEPSIYISNNQTLTKRFALSYGIRVVSYSSFYKGDSLSGGTTQNTGKTFFSVEPRFSARFLIKSNISIKASYIRISQPLHLLSNATIGMPTDIWMPSDKLIQPQTADQISSGIFINLLQNQLETSVEMYYKKMDHVIDFKDNASIKLNDDVENEILTGKGRAYGTEFLVRKPTGRFTGWMGYSLSKTERCIAGINNDRYYPARYDLRHNITTFLSQEIGKRLSVSAAFNYRTGQAVTMPIGSFYFKGVAYTYYSDRNGFRLPASHRLDLSLTLKSKPSTKRFKSEWTASLYNVYGKRNVFSYYLKPDGYGMQELNLHTFYLPGCIPMIRYSFSF